jgi:membrane-bound serine protease (ClpP class)
VDETLILAYVLIAAGLLLMLAELVFPSGLLFVIALTAVVAGVALTFGHSTTTGLITLAVVGVGVPALIGLIVHYWPRSSIGRRMFLAEPEPEATVASMPGNLELEQLRGRFGRTLSSLRPAGVTDFDGRRIDTITEGMMVEPGQLVRCIDVKAGKVVVRPVDGMSLRVLEGIKLD